MRAARVAYVAVASRLVTLLLSALFDSLVADYDTSTRLRTLDCNGRTSASGKWLVIARVVFSLRSVVESRSLFEQEAQSFLESLCGIRFSLFTLHAVDISMNNSMPSIRCCQAFLHNVADDTALGAAGLTVNIGAFALSAVCFSKLSHQVLGNKRSASHATLLYCCNPASVFYTAVYTESVYACASFLGLVMLHEQAWASTLAWCVAAAIRSNGVLYCGFILQKTAGTLMQSRYNSQVLSHVMLGVQAVAQCIAICIPTAWVQFKGWQNFCSRSVHQRPWCSSAVPNIYSFVQSHYWDVGLFRYYKMQQVPNFLLAAPMLCLSVTGCCTFCCCQWKQAFFSNKGLDHDSPDSEAFCVSRNTSHTSVRRRYQVASTEAEAAGLESTCAMQAGKQQGFLSSRTWPYVIHLAFLTATAALVMNIQVATRFLSACPAVYWYAATLQGGPYFKFVWAYFIGYFMLGTVLFPNFYPWT